MTYYIENGKLRIGVKTAGCELTSVYDLESGREYLWQGDPSFWYGQSPILFPIVGRLIDDSYTLDGKTYAMPKHGFARKSEWELLEKTEESLSFILTESDTTLEMYPYRFRLVVTFVLDGKTLAVTHCVKNENDCTMYFSIGAHPAFNCSIGDRLVFEKKETASTTKIDLEKSLRLPEQYPCLTDSRDVVITEHVFDEDALILHGLKSKKVSLYTGGEETVVFDLGGAPYLGIWAKPGAPYVCIEPWFGVNDSFERKADFSQKDGINALAAGRSFAFTWKASFPGGGSAR